MNIKRPLLGLHCTCKKARLLPPFLAPKKGFGHAQHVQASRKVSRHHVKTACLALPLLGRQAPKNIQNSDLSPSLSLPASFTWPNRMWLIPPIFPRQGQFHWWCPAPARGTLLNLHDQFRPPDRGASLRTCSSFHPPSPAVVDCLTSHPLSRGANGRSHSPPLASPPSERSLALTSPFSQSNSLFKRFSTSPSSTPSQSDLTPPYRIRCQHCRPPPTIPAP